MKVKFRKLWFGPDGFRYRPGIQDVPSSMEGVLPSSAEILKEPAPAKPAAPEKK